MKQTRKRYAIVYDVAIDSERTKIMNLLKQYGTHVQRSVFEAELTDHQRERLIAKLKPLLDEGTDSLIFYPLGGDPIRVTGGKKPDGGDLVL